MNNEPTLDSIDIWKKFESVFKRINRAFAYKPLYEAYLHNIAENLLDDGIFQMESRSFLNPKYDFDAQGNTMVYPRDTTVQIIKRVEREIEKSTQLFLTR